nr:egg cell-secreted protein 1.1-like [Tanacetum cinerariifolium]
MANSSMIIMLAIILATMSMLVNTRPLTNTTTRDASTLVERLKLDQGDGDDGGSPGCWETLLELQSCTGEIILFFMNGETYLGPACCRAIEKIEKQCWPNLMGSLGFNSQESDILRGYCDASANDGGDGGGKMVGRMSNTTSLYIMVDNGGGGRIRICAKVNSDSVSSVASASAGAEGPIPLKTAEQKLARKNKLKAKSTLMLAILDEHPLKFHACKDAKSLWEAIKNRFGGNKESKKMQKTILKQNYENFAASSQKGLDKTYNRF